MKMVACIAGNSYSPHFHCPDRPAEQKQKKMGDLGDIVDKNLKFIFWDIGLTQVDSNIMIFLLLLVFF